MQHVCIYNVCVNVSDTLTERRWSAINKARVTRCRLSNRAVVTHAEGPGVHRDPPELFITVMKPGGEGGVYVLYLHVKYVSGCVYVNVKETECMCEVAVQASDQ